jgi:cytochrome bd-type quinol oxidase subunit 2
MSSEFKALVAVVLVAIVASLGKALFHMSSSPEQSEQTVRALTVRIGLSIALFLLLLGAWHFGLISPHDLHR